MGIEQLRNEAAAIDFVRRNTCIPVPTVRCALKDHGRFYLITNTVLGIAMAKLSPDQKAVVMEELSGYLEIMRTMTSKKMGGFLGDACLPYRLAMALLHDAGSDPEWPWRSGRRRLIGPNLPEVCCWSSSSSGFRSVA